MAAEEGLPGFLFVCNNETEPKCLRSGLFGLPIAKLGEMYEICPSTALFLFNFNSVTLHGIFTPVGSPGQDLVPGALATSTGGRFPAQIRFARTNVDTRASARGMSLPLAGPLTKGQVHDLKKLLGVKMPSSASAPAAAVRRPLPFVTMPHMGPPAVAPPLPPSEAAPSVSEEFSAEELAKRRIASDGNAYTRHEFRSFYGASDVATQWDLATRATRCMHLDRAAGCFYRGCVYNHGPPPTRQPPHFGSSDTTGATGVIASETRTSTVPDRVTTVSSGKGGSSGSGGRGGKGSRMTTTSSSSSASTHANVEPSSSLGTAPEAPRRMAAAAEPMTANSAVGAAEKAPAYVFVVSPAAAREFLAYNVAGDVQARLGLMQAFIGSATELYLHCTTNRRVYGVFLPEGPPSLNFDSGFCEGNLPAQIIFKRTPMDLDVSSDELFFDLAPGPLSNAHALQLQQLFVTSSRRHTSTLPPSRQVNMRWECTVCTFHNPQPHLTCGICSSAQPDAPTWHHPPEAELTVTEVTTVEAPAAILPTDVVPSTVDSGSTNSSNSSSNSATEEGALRSLLDSFGVGDDAITSLISMGCLTLDHLAKASDAVLSAHGIKKGPRLKVLRWAGTQQATTTNSSTNASSSGGVNGGTEAIAFEGSVGARQPSGSSTAGATTEVALDAHLRLLLMQIGASSAEASLSLGGVSAVDALAMCSDADLVNLGIQHDARSKIMMWRQANFPSFVAAEDGSGAVAGTSSDPGYNASHLGGRGGEEQSQSAAPAPALVNLLNEVGIPENTWGSLAGVEITTPADLLEASDEVLEAAGLKRGPRIKLAHFKKKSSDANLPQSTSISSTATTASFVEGVNHKGKAAASEATAAPVMSAAEKAAAEKAAAEEVAAARAAAVAERAAAEKERKALVAAERAAEQAAAEREAETKKMAAAAEKAAAQKAAAEKAAAEKAAADKQIIAERAVIEKKAAEKRAAAEKAVAEKKAAAERAEAKVAEKKAAAEAKAVKEAKAAAEEKAAADAAVTEKTAAEKNSAEIYDALPETLTDLLSTLGLDTDTDAVEALHSANIFEICDLNANDPTALLDMHFKNDSRLNSKKRNKIGRWMNRHSCDYPSRTENSSKASGTNVDGGAGISADRRKVERTHEPMANARTATMPTDLEVSSMSTAAVALLEELGLGEMSGALARAGVVSLEQIASGDAEDVLEQQGVKKGPRMKLRKGAQALLSENPSTMEAPNDSAVETSSPSAEASSLSTAAVSLLEELGLSEMSGVLESAGVVSLDQIASGDAEDVLEQQGVKKGPRMKLRKGAQALLLENPSTTEVSNDSTAENSSPSADASSLSTAAVSLLEELGLGEMSGVLESAGVVSLAQIASGDAEDVLEQQGVKKGPRMKLRKGAQALALVAKDEIGTGSVGMMVDSATELHQVPAAQELQSSMVSKPPLSDEATAMLKQLELEESSDELVRAGIVDVKQFALGGADEVLEKLGIRRGLRMKLRKEAQRLIGMASDDATALGEKVKQIPMTSEAKSLLEKLGLENMTDVLASAGVATLEQFVAGEAEDFLFAYSVESQTRSILVEEARAITSSAPLRLGVRSLVLLPKPTSPPSPKRGPASQKAPSDEFAEVMEITRDTSAPSGVLVDFRKFDAAGKVVRQRGEFAQVDFGELRAVPPSARRNFRGAAAKLSTEIEAEELLRGERAAHGSDVDSSKSSAPPIVRSLDEWLEYFKELASQGVWLRSIVRPQSGWRHPETWGGPSAIAEKKLPCDVWGVVDAYIAPYSSEHDVPCPEPFIIWHRVNTETGFLEESPPREIDRYWALTDVEVVTWPDLHAYVSPMPTLVKALVQLGGCLTMSCETKPLNSWDCKVQVHEKSRAYRYLAALQALKLAYDLAHLAVSAQYSEPSARAEAEAGVCSATAALYRRILMSGDDDDIAHTHEFGHAQILPVNGADYEELVGNTAAVHALDSVLKGFLRYANTEAGLGQHASFRSSVESVGSFSMNFVKAKVIGIEFFKPFGFEAQRPNCVSALDVSVDVTRHVLNYIPSPEVAASLVIDFANSGDAKFAIALARRAGVTDIQALLPTSTIRAQLLEGIWLSESDKDFPVVSDPDVVSALATRTVSGSLRANYGFREVLGALRLTPILDSSRHGYRAQDFSRDEGYVEDDAGMSSAEDSLAVLRILVRHSNKISLLDDDEPYLIQPSDLIDIMATAVVPFATHTGQGSTYVGEARADMPFWGIHHIRERPHQLRLQSLGIAAVCSLDYRTSVPADALAPDGGWHCHLCGQGRQQAAPLCVCPVDGFSVCVRCAAAWFAARSQSLKWAKPSAKKVEDPSELQVRFEAVAEAARLVAPTTGFADLDPGQLKGWHSGPWANGGSGAPTSPYIVYAILAAVVGTTVSCAASPVDLAATAAALASSRSLEYEQRFKAIEKLQAQIAKHESKLTTVSIELQEAKAALKNAQKEEAHGITCAVCTYLNDAGSSGGGVICDMCDGPLPPLSSKWLVDLVLSKEADYAKASNAVGDLKTDLKSKVEQLETLKNKIESGESIEHGKSLGLEPFLIPGGAVDRYIWSLSFLLRRSNRGVDELVSDLAPGWEVLPIVQSPNAAAVADDQCEIANQLDTAVLSAKTAPTVFAAHPVFAAIEVLRADNAASYSSPPIPSPLSPISSLSDAQPLRTSYFARAESLAAAVESCSWLGVEACLSAGAPATLVSLPVAMKLLHACARHRSGPAAGYRNYYERFYVAPFTGVESLGTLADPSDDPLALPEGKDLELLRALLVAGASAKEDTEGEVPLVTALWLKRLDYLAIVAEFKPDPNLRDLVGDSPLHVAIYTNQLEAAATLREMEQLDCNATNLQGDSPMSLVMKDEHVKFNAIVRRYNEQFKKHKKRQKAKAKEAAAAAESSQNTSSDDRAHKPAKELDDMTTSASSAPLSLKGPTKMELMAQQLERIDALTESFLLSPDTTDTDAVLQEALDSGHKALDDGVDDDTPVAVVPWDKTDSSEAAAAFWSHNDDLNNTVFPTPLAASSSSAEARGLDTFESLVWEVELSDKVVRWFRRRAKRSSELCELVVQRLRILASGRWSYPTNQKLLKGVPKGIHLYEAKIDAAKRILWEVAVTFSERRSANLAQEGQSAVFAEGVRVWAIVEDHDDISTEVEKVVLAHRRGRTCFLKTSLASNTDPLEGSATPDELDALAAAASAEEEEDGKDGIGAQKEVGSGSAADKSVVTGVTKQSKAAAALSALVMKRGEAGPRTFLGVDGDFSASSSSSHPLPSVLSAPSTPESHAAISDLLSLEQSPIHYPPASPDPNDYKLLKFYSVTSPTLRSLLNRSGKSDASLPFKVTSKEWAILQLDTPRAILLLGRSGTGKTSCICYRLAHKWSQYWESARTCFQTPSDVLDWSSAQQQRLIEQHQQSSLTLGAVGGGGNDVGGREQRHEQTGDAPCHLRQLFLTKNPVLRGQVEDVTRSLCQAFSVKSDTPMENSRHEDEATAGEVNDGGGSSSSSDNKPSAGYAQPRGAHGIGQLQAVPDERFPLFLTGVELLRALDASLPGERFQESKLGVKNINQDSDRSSSSGGMPFDPYLGIEEQERAALADLSDYFSGANDAGDLDEGNADDDDVAVEGVAASIGAASSVAAITSAAGTATGLSVAREVTYQVFAKQLWPKMKSRDASTPAASNGNSNNNNNSQSTFEPALVWTEIKSYVKGSVEFLKAHEQADALKESVLQRQTRLKEAYLGLGRKRVSMDAAVRERVWELFLVYQKLKRELGFWDEGDLVLNLHRRFRQYGFSGILIHHVYVDEVQDFTQAELFLVLSLCRDPDQCFLAGDTAQTIARGVGFRFTDIKDIFHGMSRAVPDTFTLVHNYRSHRGVLTLAAAVVDVIYSYFPGAIDKLEPDQGLFAGPKPKLLLVDSISNLTMLLLGHQRRDATMGSIEFGAQQVVLVRSDAVRAKMPKEFTDSVIVLTVFEAKGLEFDDVLLWNFFSDGPTDDEWRAVYSYWLAKKERHEDGNTTNSSSNSGSSSSSGPLAKVSLEDSPSETAAEANEIVESQGLEDGNAVNMQASPAAAEDTNADDAAVAAATGKTPVRPLDFDAEKHKVLESELKALYCAITRARVNVWIVDFDLKKRKPAFAWFAESSLCEVVQESDDGLLDTSSSSNGGDGTYSSASSSSSSSSSRSTLEEWLSRGAHFFTEAERQESKRGFYEAAATCFRRAERSDLLARAVARLAKHNAKEAALELRNGGNVGSGGGGGGQRAERSKRSEVDQMFLAAAEKCLEAKLGREAAFCLVQGKDDERAAALYSAEAARTGSKDSLLRAAQCYTRLKRYDDSIELLWRGGYTAQAVRQAASEKRFGIAARLLDLDQSANTSSSSSFSASVDVKAQVAVQQLSRMAAKDALAKGNRAQLMSFLRVLPVLEQVAFLQSAEDTSLGASEPKASVDGKSSTSTETNASDVLGSSSTTVSSSEGVGYLGEIIAVLTRAGMHAEAAAQCAAHGEHLRGAEVLRRASAQLLKQPAPVAKAAETDEVTAAESEGTALSSRADGDSNVSAAARAAATAMMADRGPLLEAESYLRFIDEALGYAFPAFPEASNTASESASSSEIERGVSRFTEGAWVKTRMGQSGTLVGPADVSSSSDGASVGSWIVRLFDGAEVEVRSRDLTGLAARAGLKGLLQQVTQLLDQQSKDTTSTLVNLTAAVAEERSLTGADAAFSSLDEAGNDAFDEFDESHEDAVPSNAGFSSAAAANAAAKASAEEVLALVAWRRAQVLQHEAQLMPPGPAATAHLGRALEALAQLPDRIVAVASTANWMEALAVGLNKSANRGGENFIGENGQASEKVGNRATCATWNDSALTKARAALRAHACPAAVALARALVGKPLPRNSLVSSLSLVPTSDENSGSFMRVVSSTDLVMGLAPESACSHLESLLGLEPALVGDPSTSREFRRGHQLLSVWAPRATQNVLSANGANASSSTDQWTPAPGRGRTHLAMARDAARLALASWLACSATAFLRADLPEKWPDHRTVAMMVGDVLDDSSNAKAASEHAKRTASVTPSLSALTLEEALSAAKITGLEDDMLSALRNEGIRNGEQLAAAAESVLTTVGLKKGPRVKLKNWRQECADNSAAAAAASGGAIVATADAGPPLATETAIADQKSFDTDSSDWEEALANTLPGRLTCEALLEAMILPLQRKSDNRGRNKPPLAFLGITPLQPPFARNSNDANGSGALVAEESVVAAAAAVCAGASSAACGEQLLLAATHLGHRMNAPTKVADALSQLFTRRFDVSDSTASFIWGDASGVASALCSALDRSWENCREHNSLLAPTGSKSNDKGNHASSTTRLNLMAKIASGTCSDELSLSKASLVAPVHDLNLCLLAWHASGLRQLSHPSGGNHFHDFDARLADLDRAISLWQTDAEETVFPDTVWHLWRNAHALFRGDPSVSGEGTLFLQGPLVVGRLIDRLTSATAASVQARTKRSGGKGPTTTVAVSAPENASSLAAVATPASRAFVLQRQASVLLSLGLFVDPGYDTGDETTLPWSPSPKETWWTKLPSLLPWSWVHAHLEEAPLQAVHECLRKHPDHDAWPLSLRADRARTLLGCLEDFLALVRPPDSDVDAFEEAELLQYRLAACLRSELLALAWALWWEVQDTGAALVAAVRNSTDSNTGSCSEILDFERVVVLVLTVVVNAHHLSDFMGVGNEVAQKECSAAQQDFVLPGSVLGILVKAYRAAVECWQEALSTASQVNEEAGSSTTTTRTTNVRTRLEASPVGVGLGKYDDIPALVDAFECFVFILDTQNAGLCELLPVYSTQTSTWELQVSNAFKQKDFQEDYRLLQAFIEVRDSPLVWHFLLEGLSAFDLEVIGDESFAVIVEAVTAAMARPAKASQETPSGMRRATLEYKKGCGEDGAVGATVETERLALVEQRLEAAKYLQRLIVVWHRSRAKSKSRALQGRDASASGSAIGHKDDDKTPATDEERAAELLAALSPWPSSTHGCALCGVYWPKDVKAFLNNAKQRFIAMAKQAFGPVAWAAAVADVQAADNTALNDGDGSLGASATPAAKTAASSAGANNLSPSLALKAANALQMECEKRDAASRSSSSSSSGGGTSAVSVLTPKPWHELRGYSISPQFKLCLEIDAAESALNELHASAISGGGGDHGQGRSSRARRANNGASGAALSVAGSADLAGRLKFLYASAKKMFKQSAAQARSAHGSSPAHRLHFARWRSYAEAEHDLCAAAACAQLFMHRLPPADVARAMPTLGVAIEYQLVLAAKGRNYDALRRNNGKNGDKLISALKSGAAELSELHAQTAADLDDSVYLWNEGNRGESNSGENGDAAAAAAEDESDNEEGDDDDGEVDDGDFMLTPAAKKGGNGKSKSGTKGQPESGEGDGWTTVGSKKKKKNRKKGHQKGGRSRGGLVRKPRR